MCSNKINQKVTFGASQSYLNRASKANGKLIESACADLLPKSLKFFNDMHEKCKGEIGTNVINAVGTGLVAPVFIAYNPVSKADENTKKYAALRQPISAVLAVAMQFAAVYPFERLVKRMSNEGKLPKYANQTLVGEKKYLIKQFKIKHPEMKEDAIKKMVYRHQLEQYATAMENIDKNGLLKIPGHEMTMAEFKELIKETADELLKDVDKQLELYDGERTERYRRRMWFYADESEGTKKLFDTIEEHLKKNPARDESAKFFKDLLKEYSPRKTKAEYKRIIDEIKIEKTNYSRSETLKKLRGRANAALGKTPQDIMHYIENEASAGKTALEKAKETLKEIKAFTGRMAEISAVTDFKDLMQIADKLNSDDTIRRDFLYELVDKKVKNLENSFKGLKNSNGLMVGLITLPITCCILNWLYPRIVNTCFPKLMKPKTAQEGLSGAKIQKDNAASKKVLVA